MQPYKVSTRLVDCGHRHIKLEELKKGGKTILPKSWFCTISRRSPNVTNTTEQNTLALLRTQIFWRPKIQFRSVMRQNNQFNTKE